MTINDVLEGPWPERVRSVLRTLAKDDADVASTVATASVLMHGSTTRGVDDEFSDLDVWMLPPTESAWRFVEFAVAGKSGQAQVESRRDFEARIRRCDLPLIDEVRRAVLLQDHDGWGDRIVALARREMSADCGRRGSPTTTSRYAASTAAATIPSTVATPQPCCWR